MERTDMKESDRTNTALQDFMLESRLKKLDPDLHMRFTDTVIAVMKILFRFQLMFPEFTDHSELHSISVLDFCNRLIGPEQAEQLNADEIYTLMMSCYLHDVGMGVTQDQFQEFSREIDFGDYYEKHPDALPGQVIRDFHHEFSAAFIRRYGEMLDIPTEEHLFAIIQVCRGHRRTDLFDEKEYPLHYTVPNGNEIHLPYLAALIRLADEIDVAADRNPKMLYDMESFTSEYQISFHKRHEAVRDIVVTREAFLMHVMHVDPVIDQMVEEMREKMEDTLHYCSRAALERSPFRITQRDVLIQWSRQD